MPKKYLGDVGAPSRFELIMPKPKILGRLKSGRPIVQNDDDSVSTHRVSRMEFDGKTYNVPTMYKGRRYSEDQSADIIKRAGFVDPDTGEPLKAYRTDSAAKRAYDREHRDIEREAVSKTKQ